MDFTDCNLENIGISERFKLTYMNGIICGGAGSGVAFTTKKEILSSFFHKPKSQIYIVDTDGTYSEWVSYFGGKTIDLSQKTINRINLMDLTIGNNCGGDYKSEQCEIVREKADFLCDVFKDVFENCDNDCKDEFYKAVSSLYDNYSPLDPPTLVDLVSELSKRGEAVNNIKTALELFSVESLIKRKTNIFVDNRIICFDISSVSDNFKKYVYAEILSFIWNNRFGATKDSDTNIFVYINEPIYFRSQDNNGKSIYDLYLGESMTLWCKRGCKFGVTYTFSTNDTTSFIESEWGRCILNLSEFAILLSQKRCDLDFLKNIFCLSDKTMDKLSNLEISEGIAIVGKNVCFIQRANRDIDYFVLYGNDEK